MLGRNHAASACACWVLTKNLFLEYELDFIENSFLFIIVGFAALLPDIDHPDSLLGRRVKFVSVPLSYLQGDRRLLPWNENTHSRGITHSIWPLAGCLYLIAGQQSIAIAFAFGFCAHILGDALTPAGVRFLWPLSTVIRAPLTFRTGGLVEYLVTMTLVSAAAMHVLGFNIAYEIEGYLDAFHLGI